MPLVVAHVTLEPGASFSEPVPSSFEMAAYVIAGEGAFGGEAVDSAGASRPPARVGDLVLWANEGGEVGFSNPGTAPLDVLLLGGAPVEGPLVFHGPFVMNSVEQVRAAEVAFRTGRMGALE